MPIILSAKNLDLTESMKQAAEEKFDRLVRYWSEIIRIHLEVFVNRHHRHGQVIMVAGWVEVPGHDLRASTEATTFNEALDLLYGKLERITLKAKSQRRRT